LNVKPASCEQGKNAGRPEDKRRCCAAGKCCHEVLSARSSRDARDTLRAALTCAVEDEIIGRNPVSAVRLSNRREPRRRKRPAWTVDDARWFLESAWHAGETLYAAFVLILVLGLRKGEVLGLTWELIDFDTGELYVGEQLQRVGGQLVRRDVKTETSEAPLPLPRPLRHGSQAAQAAAGRRPRPRWQGLDRNRSRLHDPAQQILRHSKIVEGNDRPHSPRLLAALRRMAPQLGFQAIARS
jgi:integrase